ncbi:cyclin-like protein [Mycena olivaceomarginata]|nr:cyclin-like protein [Mycena olivaceomarginata]
MPNPNYMDSQPKLTWEMCAVLIDWLIQVHTRFRLTPETLFLCTNLIDRFLSARAISPSWLQLVVMFEETISPAITNFILVCNGAYTGPEMLQAEQRILRVDWDLSHPGPVNYLRRISNADGYDPQTRTLAKYLAEIAYVEHRLLPSPPSLLRRCDEAWTPTFAHYAMYAESALIPVAAHMLY